jgi:hypothetical protein
MRQFNRFPGSAFRVPALLAAAATLAQAGGGWETVTRLITNQSGQALSLNVNRDHFSPDWALGYRIVSGSGPGAGAGGEPEPFPETPLPLPNGTTLQLYFNNPDGRSGSEPIAVTDASGGSCGSLVVNVQELGVTLDPAKAGAESEAAGKSQAAPSQAGVVEDWSSAESVVFKLASGAQAAGDSRQANGDASASTVTASGNPSSAAARVETKSDSGTAGAVPSPADARTTAGGTPATISAAPLPEGKQEPPKALIIGEVARTRVQCTLRLSESGKELILADPEGRVLCKFEITPASGPGSELPVDIIGDISGSMEEPLANDKERPRPVPRSTPHELIYRAVRKQFPAGLNMVFDSGVRSWNMEGAMPKGGSTSLTDCLRACRSTAITVIFTDDKGGVVAREAFAEGRQKLIVTCLLTAFSIDAEYGGGSAAEEATNRRLYRTRTVGGTTAAGVAPGFGVAMMSQRDALNLIRVDTAYDSTGQLSDQAAIIGRIAAAIEKARTAKFWRITNPTRSDFIIHCPSGRSVCILPGTNTTIAPDPSDMQDKSLSNVYIHSPAQNDRRVRGRR